MTYRNLFIFLVIPSLLLLGSCNPQKRLANKKHRYMNRVYNTLKSDVSEASVTILKDSVKVIFPEHLLFGKNSAIISEENKPLMMRFAKALNLYQETSILINGYTDNSGSEDLNRALSTQRADTACATLKTFKVASKRLFTWGLGPTSPLAGNDTEEGRSKNRRVEFIVLYNYKTVTE